MYIILSCTSGPLKHKSFLNEVTAWRIMLWEKKKTRRSSGEQISDAMEMLTIVDLHSKHQHVLLVKTHISCWVTAVSWHDCFRGEWSVTERRTHGAVQAQLLPTASAPIGLHWLPFQPHTHTCKWYLWRLFYQCYTTIQMISSNYHTNNTSLQMISVHYIIINSVHTVKWSL